jgi:uncharacterized protein YggU (UPF0235/DUF167 family)
MTPERTLPLPRDPLSKLTITLRDGCVRFEVRARPRAKRSELRGVRDGALEVALAAPPVDGAANEELARFLSEELHIPKSRLIILRGGAARFKLVEVSGISGADVLARLAP